MKKTNISTATSAKHSWGKEDYYEYMDVALDAHNAAKHASVKHYANSRRKVDAEDEGHRDSLLIAAVRAFLWQAPAHKARTPAIGKAR